MNIAKPIKRNLKTRIALCFGALLCCMCCTMGYSAESFLQIYPAPQGAELNNTFDINCRTLNGNWSSIAAYNVKVAELHDARKTISNASMAYFDMEGTVEVAVKYTKGLVDSVRIRPLSYGIVATIKDSTVYFRLDKPCNISVEVNGNIFQNLHLFANPLATCPLKKKDRNLIYFGPGVHALPGDTLRVQSGQTVYVDGGAVLKGSIVMDGVENAKVMGRGIISHPSDRLGILTARSKDILIEGVITTTCPIGESNHVTVRNVKAISHHQWGDGMNVFASNNILLDGVFCRNSDDCTTVYATRMGYNGGCNHVTMQNATLWADVAHPIFIGLHGSTPNRDTIQNISYINIDILDQQEKQIDYQGCLAINVGDNNFVRNVRFEDIRIEDIRQGRLIDLRVSWNQKYCTAPGVGIENVLYKNISYSGNHAEYSIIAGYDEQRKIKGVTFEGLTINGVKIYDDMPEKPKWYKTADYARFFVGEHVEDLNFEK